MFNSRIMKKQKSDYDIAIDKMYDEFYKNCIDEVMQDTLIKDVEKQEDRDIIYNEFKEYINDSKKVGKNLEKFMLNNSTITFTNKHATQLKIGENGSLVICPNHITYLDEKSGALYKVDDDCALSALYSSENFQQGLKEYLKKGNPEKLIFTTIYYAIQENGISDLFDKHYQYYNPNQDSIEGEKKLINAIARAADKSSRSKGDICKLVNSLNNYEKKYGKINDEMAKNRLEHARKFFSNFLNRF